MALRFNSKRYGGFLNTNHACLNAIQRGSAIQVSGRSLAPACWQRDSGGRGDREGKVGETETPPENEKELMQHLNGRLASYLEKVRSLEQANSKLEFEIKEALEKRSPKEKDYRHYYITITDLQAKIMETVKVNGNLSIKLEAKSFAAKDFRVKLEHEIKLRQDIDTDNMQLRRMLDDTNVARLHLENDIETLIIELITLKKEHEREVAEMQTQITHPGVQVEVDAPTGQDISNIMEEMRAKYEKVVVKNQEELNKWHNAQIQGVQVHATQGSTALEEVTKEITRTQRHVQSLEILLESERRRNADLKAMLHDTEVRANKRLEKSKATIMHLEAELTHLHTRIRELTTSFEELLHVKTSVEAEIACYMRLLGGEDLAKEVTVGTNGDMEEK